jgi:phosphoserine phosphatase
MREPASVLAVDLDGTVVGVNSFPSFVRHLTRGLLTARRYGPLARLLAAGVLRRAGLADHRHLKRVVCTLASELPSDGTQQWAASLLDEHAHPAVVDLIRGWDGHVVLTTAAPEVYAVHFGRLLGIPEVHGSVVREGVLTDNVSHGKVVRLRGSGVERVAVFVTDDLVLDAPVAGLADRVLEVGAGGRIHECTGAHAGRLAS